MCARSLVLACKEAHSLEVVPKSPPYSNKPRKKRSAHQRTAAAQDRTEHPVAQALKPLKMAHELLIRERYS